jgi:Protein of unknown function, DUF481
MRRRVFTAAAAASLLYSLSLPALAAAQPPPAAQGTAAAPGQPAPHDLGKWWERSSLSYDPVPEKTLRHFSLAFAFTHASGNTDGTQTSKNMDFVVRKRRLTNRATVDLRDSSMTYGASGGSSDYSMATLRNHVEYDISKRTLVATGVELYHNSLYFMTSRITGYVGAGMTVVEKPHYKLSLIGGLGYSAFSFDDETMREISPDTIALLPTFTPNTAGALLMQAWRWQASKHLSIQQSAGITEYVDQDLGQSMDFSISADIPVNKHVSIGPRYTVHNEDNIYIDALPVKTVDRNFSFSVRISFE